MKENVGIWKQMLFWFYTVFVGFKLYKTPLTEVAQAYDSSIGLLSHGKPLQFTFYKTDIEFHRYRFGVLKMVKGVRYGISASFDENDPDMKELAEQYNGWLLSFYIPYSKFMEERTISRYILHIYLDYIFDHFAEHSAKHPNGQMDLPL